MILLAATVFVVAGNMLSPQKRHARKSIETVSDSDSIGNNPNDTTKMDSL